MRINLEDSTVIRQFVVNSFGPTALVWLFGSRVNDSCRGGDIDLYVEVDKPVSIEQKLRLLSKLQRSIGLRKIDLVVNDCHGDIRSIYNTAKKEGIRL